MCLLEGFSYCTSFHQGVSLLLNRHVYLKVCFVFCLVCKLIEESQEDLCPIQQKLAVHTCFLKFRPLQNLYYVTLLCLLTFMMHFLYHSCIGINNPYLGKCNKWLVTKQQQKSMLSMGKVLHRVLFQWLNLDLELGQISLAKFFKENIGQERIIELLC